MNIKNLLIILFTMMLSSAVFAYNEKPIVCKDLHGLSNVKQSIKKLDKKFNWNSSNCKIVGTKSIFPRKNSKKTVSFTSGIQLFIYRNNQLKFICLPGWTCKAW